MFTFLFKRSFGLAIAFLLSLVGVMWSSTAMAQTARTGECRYLCTMDQPLSGVHTSANMASCTTQCQQTCESACAGRGGCFVSECGAFTDGQNPLTETHGVFTRDRNRANTNTYQCGYQYAVVNQDNLNLIQLENVSNAQNKTVSEMRCWNRPFDAAKCVRSAPGATGDAVICPGSTVCCTENVQELPSNANNCVQAAQNSQRVSSSERAANDAVIAAHSSELNSFACRFTCPVSGQPPTNPQGNCLTGGCPGSGANSAQCCLPAAGGVIATTANANYCTAGPAAAGTNRPRTSGSFSLVLPACVQDGNCQLADILATGVNFANFLFGLAGAVFFGIIVYGGFRYVFFAYDSKTAAGSKDMIRNATIGLICMMMASLAVRFFTTAVKGDTCSETRGPDYSCADVAGLDPNQSEAIRKGTQRGCQAQLCRDSSSRTVLCCPLGFDAIPDSPGGASNQ